jgi:hypothetical protein
MTSSRNPELVKIDPFGSGIRRAGHKIEFTEEMLVEYKKCYENPIYFIQKYVKVTHPDPSKGLIPLKLRPFQKEAVLTYVRERFVVLLCSRQIGKALSLDTPILTPDGLKPMRDIHIGETVYGKDGKPTKVTYESPVYENRNCYSVRFDNGEEIIADEEHLWEIGTLHPERIPGAYNKGPGVKKCNNVARYEVLTTGELKAKLDSKLEEGSSIFVDVNKPVEFERKELPIDPYLLGLWLGDGYSASNRMIGLLEDMDHYLTRLGDIPYTNQTVRQNWNLRVVAFTELHPKLKALNLIKNKHIPTEYLTSSYEDRLALVQGLMDTDGSVVATGSAEFYTRFDHLARQFRTLIATLGIKGRIRSKQVKGRTYYTVRFLTTLPVVTLPRKLERIRSTLPHEKSRRHYIQSITKIESVPVKCIQVDNDDHLYLAGESLMPTHNTTVSVAFLAWYIIFHPMVNIGVLGNKESTAKEILHRLKIAYEHIPHWLKHGYESWNKRSIELENGSRCKVSATSLDAGRSESFSVVFLDEFAMVKKNTADEFMASVFPTISSGKETKMIVVSTPKGKNHFFQMVKLARQKLNGFTLLEADWRAHPDRSEKWKREEIKRLGSEDRFRQEHECLAGDVNVRVKYPDGTIKTMCLEALHEELKRHG